MREGLFSSQAPIACRRETLINHSNSPSTSGVGLNFPPHLVPYNPHGPLEIFQKLQYGPRAHLRFQHEPHGNAKQVGIAAHAETPCSLMFVAKLPPALPVVQVPGCAVPLEAIILATNIKSSMYARPAANKSWNLSTIFTTRPCNYHAVIN